MAQRSNVVLLEVKQSVLAFSVLDVLLTSETNFEFHFPICNISSPVTKSIKLIPECQFFVRVINWNVPHGISCVLVKTKFFDCLVLPRVGASSFHNIPCKYVCRFATSRSEALQLC